MLGMESSAIVIAETVIQHDVFHPFGVSLAHVLHLRQRMIPVTCRAVIGVMLTVVRIAVRVTTALVIARYPRTLRAEHTVRSEIETFEIAPTVVIAAVVDHDVSNHLHAFRMERADEYLQFAARTQRRTLVAVTSGDIPQPAVRFGTGR